MRRGRASRTAQFVALNRALGALAPTVPGFGDPIAERFLNDRWRKKVRDTREALAAGRRTSPYPFWGRGMGVFNRVTESNTGIEDWKKRLTPTLDLTEKKVGLQWGERIWVGRR
jgi:hypothetical protein